MTLLDNAILLRQTIGKKISQARPSLALAWEQL